MRTADSVSPKPGLTPEEKGEALKNQILAAEQKIQGNKHWALALLSLGLLILFLTMVVHRENDLIVVEIGTLGITDLFLLRFLAVFSLVGSILFYRENRAAKNLLEIQQGELRDLLKTIKKEEERKHARETG